MHKCTKRASKHNRDPPYLHLARLRLCLHFCFRGPPQQTSVMFGFYARIASSLPLYVRVRVPEARSMVFEAFTPDDRVRPCARLFDALCPHGFRVRSVPM